MASQVAHGGEDGEDLLRVVQHVVGLLPHFHQHVDHAVVLRGKPAVLGVELVAQQQTQGVGAGLGGVHNAPHMRR
ncbi:hypothetical protein D3C72_1788480 [compost metagenome]